MEQRPPLTNSFKVLLEKFLRFESDFELQRFEKQVDPFKTFLFAFIFFQLFVQRLGVAGAQTKKDKYAVCGWGPTGGQGYNQSAEPVG